jgi:hypothetical protein
MPPADQQYFRRCFAFPEYNGINGNGRTGIGVGKHVFFLAKLTGNPIHNGPESYHLQNGLLYKGYLYFLSTKKPGNPGFHTHTEKIPYPAQTLDMFL